MPHQTLNLNPKLCGMIIRELRRALPDEVPGEQMLWVCVIFRAIEDARTRTRKHGSKTNTQALYIINQRHEDRAKAINWLFGKSKGFADACCMADLDPEYIRRVILKINGYGAEQ